MLQVYSTNITVGADTAIPFNNVKLKKGCSAVPSGTSTIELNKCGVYRVSVNATAEASTTIQLYKNGVAQPETQCTGTSLYFSTFVQVSENNCGCPCSAPTLLQVLNTTAGTFTTYNMTIDKLA